MTGAAVEIRADDSELLAGLRRLRRWLDDQGLRDALDEIGAGLETTTVRRFETGLAPDRTPWKPSGRARRDGGRTLADTGRLRDSITRVVGDDVLQVGTNVKYGGIHQFGGKTKPHEIRPRRKKALAWPGARHPVKSVKHPGSRVPARPYLGVSPADRRAIAAIVNARLRSLWR